MNNHEQAPSTNDNPSWENLSDVEPRFEVQNRVAEKFKSGKAKETLMRALKATLLAAGVAATVFMSKGEAPANNAPTAISQEVEPKGDDTNAGDFVEPMGLTEEVDNAIDSASPAADPVNRGNAEVGGGRNISESDHLPSPEPEAPPMPEPKAPDAELPPDSPPGKDGPNMGIESPDNHVVPTEQESISPDVFRRQAEESVNQHSTPEHSTPEHTAPENAAPPAHVEPLVDSPNF